MKAIVTGAAGFLGSHLCNALVTRGYEVVGYDSLLTGSIDNLVHLLHDKQMRLIVADVAHDEVREPADVVFHLASPASPKDYERYPLETMAANSEGTRRMLELAERCGARFVLASTSEVYGDPEQHPQTEGYWGNVNPIGERSMYDESKRFAEAMTAAYRRAGANTGIVRIFNTYGPRMRAGDGRVIPTFIGQAFNGEPLTVYGDGSQTRSLCYASDTVRAFLSMADTEFAGPVNIGNPDEQTILQIAEAVIRQTGSASRIEYSPLPADDPKRRRPDITTAAKELGWQPSVDFENGLADTIFYFKGVL